MEKKQTKRFLTIFQQAENSHLLKDVGSIPYYVSKTTGWQATLASYENETYASLEKERKGLHVSFIKKRFSNDFLNQVLFIWENRRKYDVLQMYHYNRASLICLNFFKWVTIFKGKTYLKLDADNYVKQFRYVGFNGFMAKLMMRTIDLVSVESTALCEFINENNLYGRKVVYIPNGFQALGNVRLDRKEKRLLTVGRLGTYQKATDLLLEAFRAIAHEFEEWHLDLVGKIERDFEHFTLDFFKTNPHLRARIHFIGYVTDHCQLRGYYEKASIFMLPSRYESFGFVSLEAMDAYCVLVASDIPSLRDITHNGRYGYLFPVEDVEALIVILRELLHKDLKKGKNQLEAARTFISEHFHWESIVSKITDYLS